MEILILFIDSSKMDEIIVSLSGNGFEERLVTKIKDNRGSQVILLSIQKVLEKKGKSLQDITEIVLYEGSGSYTGRRVGASIANTLSYTLTIPINKQKLGVFVYPSYE